MDYHAHLDKVDKTYDDWLDCSVKQTGLLGPWQPSVVRMDVANWLPTAYHTGREWTRCSRPCSSSEEAVQAAHELAAACNRADWLDSILHNKKDPLK